MLIRKTWMAALALSIVALAASASQAATPSKYLPDDAEMVVRVNIKDLLETDIIKKNALEQIKEGLRSNPQATLIFETLNFDPLKDIHSITISAKDLSANLPMGGGGGEAEYFMIVTGNFNLDKIHSTLADASKQMGDKLSVGDYSGVKVYEGKQDDKPNYFAFVDKTTAVLSNKKPRVTEAIDVSLGKRKPNPSRTLVNMLAKVSESQGVIMAMPISKGMRDAMKQNPQAAVVAEKLEGLTGGVTAGKDANADIHIHTTDPQAAMQLRQQIEALKAFGAAAIQNQNNPGAEVLAEMLQNMKTSAEGKVITLKVTLTQEMVDKAKKAAGQ